MRTALITTTINVPRVLELYRKLGPDVRFFVAGDKKTPREAYEFVLSLGENSTVCLPESGHKWKCSEPIGWNCIQRRNIALLEAVKWGADNIVTIDDDNVAFDGGYFESFIDALDNSRPWFGLLASSPTAWFDPGCLLVPQTKHRGFPINVKSEPSFSHVVDAKIGVAAGLCLGDPDIDAVTRIATAPIIHSVSELGRAGVVVAPGCKTVFNSQNTAFIRELAPAMFMMPGVGRYDDIYASLITQRVMRERGLHVHFGQPFVWQQRNQHNLVNDLRMEIDGMENVEKFAAWLDAHEFTSHASVTQQVREIFECNGCISLLPTKSVRAAHAFLDDMEDIL